MTIPEAKQKLVNWCNSQVGYHESWDGTNKYGAESDWIRSFMALMQAMFHGAIGSVITRTFSILAMI